MATRTPPLICYWIRTRYDPEIRSNVLTINVWIGRRESVQELLEGTVGNRAGYGSPEAAEKLGRKFRLMLDEGITEKFEHLTYGPGSASTQFRWTDYTSSRGEKGYVGAKISCGGEEKYSHLQATMKLVDQIAARITAAESRRLKQKGYGPTEPGDWCFDSPKLLVDALDRMDAVRLTLWEPRGPEWTDWDREWIQDTGPRERFRDEDVFTLFETRV